MSADSWQFWGLGVAVIIVIGWFASNRSTSRTIESSNAVEDRDDDDEYEFNPFAFPGEDGSCYFSGMELRDYFAGQACRALVEQLHGVSPDYYAARSYEIADAMLHQRAKTKPNK